MRALEINFIIITFKTTCNFFIAFHCRSEYQVNLKVVKTKKQKLIHRDLTYILVDLDYSKTVYCVDQQQRIGLMVHIKIE